MTTGLLFSTNTRWLHARLFMNSAHLLPMMYGVQTNKAVLGVSIGAVALLLLILLAVLQRKRAVTLRCKQQVLRFSRLLMHQVPIDFGSHEIPMALIAHESTTFLQDMDEDLLRDYIQEKITW